MTRASRQRGLGAARRAQRAAGRLRMAALGRLTRLRASAVPIVQTAVGAAVAWLIASSVLGHRTPFLACVAAVLSLNVTGGRPTRRALEVVLGVAVGVVIADGLVRLIGPGPLSIVVVTPLAMSAGVLLGGGPLLVTQAGISAILIATVQTSSAGPAPDRLVDALVGGVVALIVSGLILPADPIALAARAARPLLESLASALDDSAAALAAGDPSRATGALLHARALDQRVATLEQAIEAGWETTRLAPARRHAVATLARYADAAPQLDLAVRNVRVLARAVGRTARAGPAPDSLAEAVGQLADAVRALDAYLDDSAADAAPRSLALQAARRASAVVDERSDPATVVVVSQVRSAAIDLLRATGMNDEASRQALEEAAGPLSGPP